MIIEIDRRPRIKRTDVFAQGGLESRARVVAELHHPIPALIPGDARRHRLAVILLEFCFAILAPASVRRAEALIQHVDMKSVDSISEHFGGEALDMFKIA